MNDEPQEINKSGWIQKNLSLIILATLLLIVGTNLVFFVFFFKKLDKIVLTNSAVTGTNTTVRDTTPVLTDEILSKIYNSNPPVLGNPDAKVTIIEYADFQCPYCERWFQDVYRQLKSEYIDTGKVKFVFQSFAFLGPESLQSAIASKCAMEQGKFWEYYDSLYINQKAENSGGFADNKLKSFAQQLKLNQGQFDDCLDTGKYADQIQAERDLGVTAKVSSTPTTFINKTALKGALPYSYFKTVIEEALQAK